MALDQVRLGTPPSGSDGDDPRTAFTRINNNFTVLDNSGFTGPVSTDRDVADLSNAITPGRWTAYSNPPANRPPGFNYVVADVFATAAGVIVQEVTDMTTRRRAIRILGFDQSWSQWSVEGSAASLSAGSAPGNVLLVGDRNSPTASTINTWGNSFQIWTSQATAGAPEAGSFGMIINAGWPSGGYGGQIMLSVTGRIYFRCGDYTSAVTHEIYHNGNTTRGSGGVLSAASPIVRIADVARSERRDLLELTFKQAGPWGAANDEAPGVSVERVDVGVYRITGALGLAVEGWRIHDPCSPDGGRTLGLTESEQDDNGVVTIRLFKQRWTLDDDGEMHLGKGAPLDVPLSSWIDVRLHMPPAAPLPDPDVPAPATEAPAA